MSDVEKFAPDKIYLQYEEPDCHEGVTWCQDKINDNDVEYIRTKKHLELLIARAETEFSDVGKCGALVHVPDWLKQQLNELGVG